jgi:hypothetical protein
MVLISCAGDGFTRSRKWAYVGACDGVTHSWKYSHFQERMMNLEMVSWKKIITFLYIIPDEDQLYIKIVQLNKI